MKPILSAWLLSVGLLAVADYATAQQEPDMHRAADASDRSLRDEDLRRIMESLRGMDVTVMQEGDMHCTQLAARVDSLESLVARQSALIAALEAELARQREGT